MDEPVDKMRMVRNKMVDARQAADRVKDREAMAKTEVMRKKWNDEDLIHAKDVDNKFIQDIMQLVAVGADVEALYPNLSDIEVANICYEAVMKSKISFNNITTGRPPSTSPST